MSLLSVDPWPLCPECERRVRLDFIADGGIVRWRHVDGTAGCPEGAARAWRGVVGLLCGWAGCAAAPQRRRPTS